MSQEDVAFRAGLHRTQISLLEQGDRLPRAETLIKLAGALGATPNDLLDGISFRPLAVVTGGFEIEGQGQDRE
jgi:transcriptional regulator with XRE-family HTH domain